MFTIDEVRRDLEYIDEINNQKATVWNSIPENNNTPPNDKLNLYRRVVRDLNEGKVKNIENKYIDIFNKAGVFYSPPYDSSDLEEFLKFFITLYDLIEYDERKLT